MLLYKYKCLWSKGVKAEVQVSRRELYTHSHLNYSTYTRNAPFVSMENLV